MKFFLPNVLIVGAMKSATTGLYDDIALRTEVFAPRVKEPAFLAQNYSDDRCRFLYSRLFRKSGNASLRLEGSTGYTMMPRNAGVAERARRILGANIRILYLVREPFGRILSHYRHSYRIGAISVGFKEALLTCPDLIDFSRYSYQINPWLQVFGEDRVYVAEFDFYARSREAFVRGVDVFLGLSVLQNRPLSSGTANRGADRTSVTGPCQKLLRSGFYKTTVTRMVPDSVRSFVKERVGQTMPSVPAAYTPELFEHVHQRVLGECMKIASLCRCEMEDPKNLWDFERLRSAYL